MLISARSTCLSTRGRVAASSSRTLMCLGFSAMSFGVAVMPAPSLRVITPALASSSRARPPLVASLGMATLAPSGSSSRLFSLLE
ncbi:hypothetical protein D3C86_1791740 [compost metagenome]